MKIFVQGARLVLQALTQGAGGGELVDMVSSHFANPTQSLRNAVQRANSQTLLAVDLSLRDGGISLRLRQQLTTGVVRGALASMQRHIAAEPDEFRGACLAELAQARAAGVFTLRLDDDDLALASGHAKIAGLRALIQRLEEDIAARVDALDPYPRLGSLLLRREAGSALLITLFNYFLEQAILEDDDLREVLRIIQAQAEQGAEGLAAHRNELADLRASMDRLPDGLSAAFTAIAEQIRAESLALQTEVRMQLGQLGGGVGSALPRLTQVIQDPEERRLVRELLARYRQLPMPERPLLAELPTELGTLQMAVGDTAEAETLFLESGDAKATFQRFRLYLEERRWEEAKACMLAAAQADPARYALFPLGKYVPEQIIGWGGFGVALVCRHCHLGHRVVIKALLARRSGSDASMVVREGQVLKNLSHPAIIRVEDSDYADAAQTRPYLVLEYFPDSCSLAEWVKRSGPLDVGAAQALASPMAEALAAAHDAGILHRDVTPENLLVRRDVQADWKVKLIDFGLAARRDWAAGVSERYRETLLGESAAGKLDYGAPEQMEPHGKVGRYTDVFGFGKTLCFALFTRPNPTLNDWERVGQHHPFVRLLNRCIHEDPRQRPRDFREVLSAMARGNVGTELLVDSSGGADFATLSEAVTAAAPGSRIHVRPGRYAGPICIDRPLEIVGDGAAADILLVAEGEDALTWRAERGLVANLTIRQQSAGDWFAVVVSTGRLELEGCDISNRGNQACVGIEGDATVLLTRNRIHDGGGGGVVIVEQGRGTLTFNAIYANALAGLELQDKGECQAHGNQIRDGRRSGVLACQQAQVELIENQIQKNLGYGIVVNHAAELILERNAINGNRDAGVAVCGAARCRSSGNDLSRNAAGAWYPPALSADKVQSEGDSESPERV